MSQSNLLVVKGVNTKAWKTRGSPTTRLLVTFLRPIANNFYILFSYLSITKSEWRSQKLAHSKVTSDINKKKNVSLQKTDMDGVTAEEM